ITPTLLSLLHPLPHHQNHHIPPLPLPLTNPIPSPSPSRDLSPLQKVTPSNQSTSAKAAQSQQSDSWRRNSPRQLRTFLVDKRVIMRIWIMSGCVLRICTRVGRSFGLF